MDSRELRTTVQRALSEVADGINMEAGRPIGYDQTNGNQCHLLTLGVFNQLRNSGIVTISRELHQDNQGNWHYLLRHTAPGTEPTAEDTVSDLNPWQGRKFGGELLHGTRQDVLQELQRQNMPDSFIALRSVTTITAGHDIYINPYSKQTF